MGPQGGSVRDGDARVPRRILRLDEGWRFLQSEATGADGAAFDDSSWRPVTLPHDWSISGPFDPSNATGGAGGFLPSGKGWYRRHFSSGAFTPGSRVFAEFDGVMANSDVWINGFHLGGRPYGYVGFSYELTGHLNPADNVLAVRVDDSGQPASRWYTGAGITRHVRLVVTGPVHVVRDSTFVWASDVTADRAIVHVRTTVVNQSDGSAGVRLGVTLTGPRGEYSAHDAGQAGPETVLGPGKSVDLLSDIVVAKPALWDIDAPSMYQASVAVESGGSVADADEVHFGIRDARFEAATGFWLNGQNLKIKGVCVHSDGGAFGAAVPLGVWRRRLDEFRKLGVNAIRTAHNPPDPGFLDLCDSKGFLVMDEMFDCWTVAKNPFDYHLFFNDWSQVDTRDTVRRDRNHPCIVLWSAGNEIHDTPDAELSKRILAGLVRVFHENDPTRPVTQALFRPNISHDYDDGLADLLDVVGTNYRNSELLAAHVAKPSRRIIGTEMGQGLDVWKFLRDNPALAGQFLWVGVDYLGESPRWPYIGGGGDQAGLIDRTGLPRPQAYQRESWWSSEPMVHVSRRIAPEAMLPADPGYGNPPKRRPAVLLSDWNPSSMAPHDETVEVYCNAERVELFLNGLSLGSRAVEALGAPCVWRVPFEAGKLSANALSGGRVVATDELRTAGRAAAIRLESDVRRLAPGWDNVAFVRATIVDAEGIRVPGADALVTFRIEGPAEVAAVDNADNASHEAFGGMKRNAYQGRCLAVVRATGGAGVIKLSASADGLISGSAVVVAEPDSP